MSLLTGELRTTALKQLATDDGRCAQDMPDPSWCANCICGVRATMLGDPVVAGQTSLLDEPYPTLRGGIVIANYAARCRCRPGCLSIIEAGDEIQRVGDGWAILEHAEQVA